MSKLKLATKMLDVFHKTHFEIQKKSPEILITAGVIGVVAAAVGACRATTKIDAVLEGPKKTIDKIHECVNNPEVAQQYKDTTGEDYTEEIAKKDLAITYGHAAWGLVKLYAPWVVLGATSIGCIVASNNILRKRNVALAAAYATVDKGFKAYRNRVVERFGEEVDYQLKHNVKIKEIEETVTDENGNVKTVVKTVNVINPEDVSGYARFFEEYTRDEDGNVIKNPYWESNGEYRIMFLKSVERYMNDRLRATKRVFLNEVYEALGLPKSKEGQIVGWVYNPDNPIGDNYIDFGLYKFEQNYSDFVYGEKEAILLDFNVDGNIWELM